jgi:hypothetical protein
MSPKLWFLNFLLLALAVFAGFQLRARWLAEKAREAAEIHHQVAPIPGPPYTPTPAPPAAAPVNYAAIAQKDLFDRSRNPDVPVEPPPPPPPKPPMPPLPVFYGEMNIGDGPTAILSINAGSPQHSTHPGEMIGAFKLIDVTRDDLTLEWNGELVRKSVDELTNHGGAQPQDTASEAQPNTPPPVQARAEPATAKGPGGDGFNGSKLCQPNDSSPFGTVQDGLVKTEIKTPFGTTCLWDPKGK